MVDPFAKVLMVFEGRGTPLSKKDTAPVGDAPVTLTVSTVGSKNIEFVELTDKVVVVAGAIMTVIAGDVLGEFSLLPRYVAVRLCAPLPTNVVVNFALTAFTSTGTDPISVAPS